MDSVGVRIRLEGYEQFRSRMREAQSLIKSTDGKDITIDFNAGYKGLQSQLKAVNREIKDIDRQMKGTQKFTPEMEGLKYNKNQLQAVQKDLQNALEITPHVNIRKAFQSGKSVMGAVGTSIETIGNGISQLARNPLTQVFTGMFRQIGVGMTGLMQQGLSQSVERFDTMRTYPKMMEKLGFSSKQSEASIKKLNKSVLGLPTSLSDIVSASNRYSSAMGDIEKGTDLAIAANNAFLASTSSDLQKRQGETQLNNLIAGKELTGKQWQSLYGAMPVALAQVGKDMGYATTTAFQKELYAGQIDNKQLINALIKSGTGEGALVEMANVSKSTMQGVITNIQTAFARMGAGILDALDTAFLEATGKNFVGVLSGVIDQIDGLTARMTKWVKNNPDKIKSWIDSIKSIDFMGFIKGFGEGLMTFINAISAVVKHIPFAEKGIGRLLGFLSFAGAPITFIGQITKGFSFMGGIFNVLLKFGSQTGMFAKIGGVFTKIASLFTGLRKVDKAVDVASLSSVASKTRIAKARFMGLKANFKSIAMVAGEIVIVAGTATAIVGAITAIAWLLKQTGNQLKQIQDLNLDIEPLGKNLAVLAGFSAIVGGIGAGLANLPAVTASLLVGLAELDLIMAGIAGFTWLGKKSMQNLNGIADGVSELISSLKKIQEKARSFHWDGAWISAVQEAMADLDKLNIKEGGGRYSWWDKHSSKNTSKVVEQFKKTLDSFVKITESLEKIKVPKDESIEIVTKITEFMGDFYAKLEENEDLIIKLDQGRSAKKKAGNISELMGSFKTSIETIKGIVDTYKAMEENLKDLSDVKGRKSKKEGDTVTRLDKVTTGIETILESMSKIIKSFEEHFRNHDYAQWKDTGKMGEMMTDLSGFINTIKTVVGTLGDMEKSLTNLGDRRRGGQTGFEKIESLIKRTIGSIGRIADKFNEEFDGGVIELDRINTMTEKITAIKKALNSIKKIVTIFGSLQGDLANLVNSKVTQPVDMGDSELFKFGGSPVSAKGSMQMSGLDAMVLNIGTLIETLKEIKAKINQIQDVGDIDSKTESLMLAMDNLKQIAMKAQMMIEPIQALAEYGIDGDDGFTGQLESLISGIKGSLDVMGEVEDASELTEKAQALTTIMGEIEGVIQKVQAMQESMGEGGIPTDGDIPVVQAIENLISNLHNALTGEGMDTEGLAVAIQQFSSSLSILSTALQNFASVDGIPLVIAGLQQLGAELDNIKGKLDELDGKFKGKGSKWGQEVINGFRSANVGGVISSLLSTALGARDFSSNGFSTGQSYGLGIQNGINSISIDTSGLMSKIATAVQAAKNYAQRQNIGFTPKRRGKMWNATNQANGGLVYASKGMLVNFQPKGSDTVPAMLTPGEFVQRKSAVNHFGAKFMERINALDLPGALNSLSFRGSTLATANGASVVINNTRNNNAQVVQHNNVQHTGTALKHANRWVKKL